MSKLMDLTGNRYGRLVVIERADSLNGKTRWKCRCDCGKEVVVHKSSLLSGNTQSCGCLRIEAIKERSTHGMTNSRLYNIWCAMKGRCYTKSNTSYNRYGALGIKVCKKWRNSFEAFYEWAINNGYNDNLTIERIDSRGNYEPNNCRWATALEQNNNKKNIPLYKIGKIEHTLPDWCREYGMSRSVVHQRVRKLGWDIERALTTPVKIIKR